MKKYTKDALSNASPDELGHLRLLTLRGKHVLTVIHPFKKDISEEIPQEEIDEFEANVKLHQHAQALHESLESTQHQLKLLLSGEINIFNFPIKDMIAHNQTVLNLIV